MIVLYSTGCPRCKVLETKLKQKNVEYTECNDVFVMQEKGITTVPCLAIDGEIMDFGKAVKWVNSLEG